MRCLMMDIFLPKNYEYKMNIEHEQGDETVHNCELDYVDNMSNVCPQQ